MMMMCSSSPSRSLVANVLVSSSDSSSSSRGHVSYRACRFCPCSRRHFLVSSVLPTLPANACDPMAVLNNVHPPRPDWYEEFYASVIDQGMKAYEAEVGEALPMRDASMDAVIGTLVLCSVKDVDMTLQEVKRVLKPGGQYIFIEHVAANDGTPLKLLQQAVDPLQQLLFDGCHLCRETGKIISEAGFLDANVNMAFVSSVSLISPHVYGVAFK
eukprot:TRINITY_DN2650_c0_g1_i2.p1 TRINITY_DN2650_c0_g1~~TRINITY_DN2650_c0_g1_i2.p1  ORF type:complete len:214 (-),score=42.55 TRINITY_DN2650_c0_g1_i2:164-805(-)